MEPNGIPEKGENSPAEIKQVQSPQISEIGSLGTIFFEPERTFLDFRIKPRFIVAGIISALLIGVYVFALQHKVGEAGVRSFVEKQVSSGFGADRMTPEQKDNAVNMQMTISSYTTYLMPVFVMISFVIGGLLYWLGAKAFGGDGSLLANLGVWVYSGLPPIVVAMIANFIVLAIKSADEIDLGASQRGVIHANPSFFIDGKEMPVVATLLSTFDVFMIWGWVLAAIGLSAVNKLSKASAWTIVLSFAVISLAFRLIGAILSGNPG